MTTRLERSALADLMTVTLAREVRDGDVVGVGLGTPLAVVAALLARATHAPRAHVLVGGAVNPRADVATCLRGPVALAGRTAGFVPHLDTMDMAERQAMTLQFLRPAQIDGQGNLNTSRIGPPEGPSVRFPGGLATGDVTVLLPRLVCYLPDHRPRNLPERVACVTGAGGGWSRGGVTAAGTVLVLTDLCVFAVHAGAATLRSVHPGVSVDDARAATGFTFAVPDTVATTVPVTQEEQAALAALDGSAQRLRELRVPAGTTGGEGSR